MRKSILIALLAGTLISIGLSGCMFMSDSQKRQAAITSGKLSGQDLLRQAGEMLNDSSVTESQRYTLTYRLAKIDRDKSYTAENVDSEEWDIIALNTTGAGRWVGQSIRDNEPLAEKLEFLGAYYPDAASKGHENEPYLVYYTPEITSGDSKQEWLRGWRQGLFAGLVTNAIDYTKLASVGEWEVNKTPVVKNGKTLTTVKGTVSFDDARNFLKPIEDALDFVVDPRLSDAEKVDIVVNFREDGYIDDFSLSFVPDSTAHKSFIYSSWKLNIIYGDINSYSSFSFDDEIVMNATNEEEHKQTVDYGVEINIDQYREDEKKSEKDSDVVQKQETVADETKADDTKSEDKKAEQIVDPQNNTKKVVAETQAQTNTTKKKK